MITIETQVSGAQIAGQLCNDQEEMAYALQEMAERDVQNDAEEIAVHLSYGSADGVIKMLRELADNLSNETQ